MSLDAQPAGPALEEDPFAEFDAMMGADVRDPHPEWRRRRLEGPVLEGTPMMGNSVALAEAFMAPGKKAFSAYSWDTVHTVLREADVFSSAGYDDSIGLVMGHMILAMDEPEHMDHRALVAQAFRLKTMQNWEGSYIEPLVHEIIDTFADRGRANLMSELTFVFPVQVIAAILGLPRKDWAAFQRLSIELIGVAGNIERGLAASTTLRDYFAEILAERRKKPTEDLISQLANAEVDGQRLEDEAIYSFLRLLLPAGAETTFRSSSNLIYLLLTHPEQFEKLKADRSLVLPAIDEGLRLEPPLAMIGRTTTRDYVLDGVEIPAQSSVMVCMAAANRDEAVRERPDEFDITRASTEHVAFASGPHMCLGMHLARAETRVVVNAVVDRLPDLQLDMSEDPHVRGVVFRSPSALPVTWRV